MPGTARGVQLFANAQNFIDNALFEDELAAPVPGGEGRPWLIGTFAEQKIFAQVFASTQQVYTARKGVTTDRNGIYWVKVLGKVEDGVISVRNAPEVGRTKGIPTITAEVEEEHVFPLLRGRGVSPFSARPDADLCVVVPQRGMHGDPNLAKTHPLTFKFLHKFKALLEQRSSLKRYQPGQVYYSLWSTGKIGRAHV